MKKYIKRFLDDIDLEKLQYKSLSLYQKLLHDNEVRVGLEQDLPNGIKMNDIKIEYEDVSIHFKNEQIRTFLNFNLNLKGEKVGYYKTEYSIDENIFIDDFLVFY